MGKAICMRNSNFGLDDSSNLLELYSSGFLQGLERKRQKFSASLAGIIPDSFYKSKLTQRYVCHTLTYAHNLFLVLLLLALFLDVVFFSINIWFHCFTGKTEQTRVIRGGTQVYSSFQTSTSNFEMNETAQTSRIWSDLTSYLKVLYGCVCACIHVCVFVYTHTHLQLWQTSVARV